MYAGKVMERGDVYELFESAGHPYTQALLRCLPGRGSVTQAIGGSLPDPIDPPMGCRFHPRCPHAVRDCEVGDQPDLLPVAGSGNGGDGVSENGHRASCVYYGPGYDVSVVRGATPGTDGQEGDGESPESGIGDRMAEEGPADRDGGAAGVEASPFDPREDGGEN
jgi:peptide/nickel transport system ATP-binding protein